MDICKDIHDLPIYKVKVWKPNTERQLVHSTFVYIGKEPKHTDILQKIEDNETISRSDSKILKETFGEDFHKYDNVQFVHETLYEDDNINTIKKKICMYQRVELNENDIYLWINKRVKNTVLFRDFLASQLLSGEKRGFYHEVQRRWNNHIVGIPFPEEENFSEIITYEEVMSALNRYKVDKVTEPLGIKHVRNNTLVFVPVNPFENNEETDVNEIDVRKEGTLLLEYHSIDDNVINMTTYDVVNNHDLALYFPNHEDHYSQNDDAVFQKYDNTLYECNSYQLPVFNIECSINSLHLRLNDVSMNDTINVRDIFEKMKTKENVPFMKYNNNKTKIYKVDKNALNPTSKYYIDRASFNVWTEATNDNKGRTIQEYCMFKVWYKTAGDVNRFITVTIYPDTHVDIRYNIRSGDNTNLDNVKNTFPLVNALIEDIREHVPEDIYLPNIDMNFLESHEYSSNCKLVNMMSSIQIIGKYKNSEKDVRALASKLFPYFNIIQQTTKEKKKTKGDDKQKKKENILSLQYTRVNNFAKDVNVANFLDQMADKTKDEQLDALQTAFQFSKEEAEREYSQWMDEKQIERKNIYLRPSRSGFVLIRLKPYFSGLGFRADIDGVTDIKHHRRIVRLLKFILHNAIPTQQSKLKRIMGLSTEEQQIFKEVARGKDAESDENNSNAKIPASIAAQLRLLRNEYLDDEPDVPAEEPDDAPAEEPEQEEKQESPKETFSEEQYVIKRLNRADPKLFGKGLYSKKCQWVQRRQPIVITQEELEKINQTQPGSYENSIAFGTDAEKMKKNIYICPEVWCPISRVSMTKEQYDKVGCPEPEEKAIELINDYYRDKDEKLKKRYVGFITPECMPCCFKTEPKIVKGKPNKQIEKQQRCLEPETTAAESKKAPELDTYIVGEQYPLDKSRLGVLPESLSLLFENDKCGDNKKGTGHITDDTNCFLRMGIYHNKGRSLLNCLNVLIHDTDIDMIKLLKDNMNLQEFVALNNGVLIGLFLDNTRTIMNTDEFKAFKKWFLTKNQMIDDYIINFDLFKVRASLASNEEEDVRKLPNFKHILREYLVYNAFTSFVNYLEDDNIEKHYDIILDIFNGLHDNLNPKGYNIILFDIEGENIYAACPYGNHSINISRPFVFIVKQDMYYEPICKVKKHGKEIVIDTMFKYDEEEVLQYAIDIYTQNCTVDKKDTDKIADSVYPFLGTIDYRVNYMVIDYSYNLIGFIVKKGIFVPCPPQTPLFIRNVPLIYVDELKNKININGDAAEIRKLLASIHNIVHHRIYLIRDVVRDDEGVIGFTMSDDTFVPISKKSLRKYQERYLDNLNLFIQWEEDDERKVYVENERQKELLFTILHNEVIRVIKKEEDNLKKEIEFLLWTENPIPLVFRQKKLKSILIHLMKKIIVEVDDEKVPIDKVTCHTISKSECNGLCVWNDETCKLKVPRRILDFYQEKLAYTLIQSGERIQKLQLRNDKQKEIIFDQHDVDNKKVDKILHILKNPYVFLNKVVGDTVENIIEENTECAKTKLSQIFTPYWKTITPETPHNKEINIKDDAERFIVNALVTPKPKEEDKKQKGKKEKKDETDEEKEKQIKKEKKDKKLQDDLYEAQFVRKEFFFELFCILKRMVNSRVKLTMETFTQMTQNNLIKDFQNDSDFIKSLKMMNPCIQQFSDKNKKITMPDILTFLESPGYRPSQYELQIMANLLGLNIVLIGRSGTHLPNGVKWIHPQKSTKLFVMLQFTRIANAHVDMYEIIVKNKDKPQILFHKNDYPKVTNYLMRSNRQNVILVPE
jgi:hypothetical protein